MRVLMLKCDVCIIYQQQQCQKICVRYTSKFPLTVICLKPIQCSKYYFSFAYITHLFYLEIVWCCISEI